MEFYRQEPTALTSWRLAVLMGANSRTYKFALADALLAFARQEREDVPLSEFVDHYAVRLVQHLADAPQGPATSVTEGDFLAVASAEAPNVLATGVATERLVSEAERNVPMMVMRKFHNLRTGELPHRFYALSGRGSRRRVLLTPELRAVAAHEQAESVDAELAARWSIVETSFASGVGASLVQDGVLVDLATMRVTDVRRRRTVTGVHEAVVGFQHGRCLLCGEPISSGDAVAVDHVFPFALMKRAGWTWSGPDLDAIWNLAPAHWACNAAKSDAMPTAAQRLGLAHRNAAIIGSPHPLSRTLRGTLRRAGLQTEDAAGWLRLFETIGL